MEQSLLKPFTSDLGKYGRNHDNNLGESDVAYYFHEDELTLINNQDSHPFTEYLKKEFDVSRLNKIHKYLKLAGRPSAPRPLHRQVLIGRQLVTTEQADLHLTWYSNRLYLKPLPAFLVTQAFWSMHLLDDALLYGCTKGFLLSWVWLIRHRSDFNIALAHRLLPEDLLWSHWLDLTISFINRAASSPGAMFYCWSLTSMPVNERYEYGELRLSRLNWIYRLSPSTFSMTNFIRGYSYKYDRYGSFLARNTSWLLAAVIYATVVLTAMQVGLATSRFNADARFQSASAGFSVFAIMGPLVILGGMIIIILGLVIFNYVATVQFRRRREQRISLFQP